MTYIKKLYSFIFVIIMLSSLSLMAQEKIVVSGIQGSMEDKLVDQKILKEAYSRIGYELIYEQVPSIRALNRAVNGESDAASSRVSSAMLKYPSLIKIPVPFYSVRSILVSKNHTKTYDVQTLRKLRIGIQRGVKVVENKVKNMEIPNSKITSSAYIESLFKMLANDRLDVVLVSQIRGLRILKKLKNQHTTKYKDIKEQITPFTEVEVFHFVNKKNKHLVPQLTKALQEMEEEGFIKKIKSDFVIYLNAENNR